MVQALQLYILATSIVNASSFLSSIIDSKTPLSHRSSSRLLIADARQKSSTELSITNSNSNNQSQEPNSNDDKRRLHTRRSFMAGSIILFTPPKLAIAENGQKQKKAKGAAEYDLEFYLRDLVQGNNNPGGNISSSAPPPKKPSRTLTTPLQPLLLDDFYSSTTTTEDAPLVSSSSSSFGSIPAKLLLNALQQPPNSESASSAETTLLELVNKYRSASKRGFASKAQWQTEQITDQYYFDVTSYAVWRSAAKIIPNFKDRDQFVRNVGKEIYKQGKDQQFFSSSKQLSTQLNNSNDKNKYFKGPLTQTIPALTEIMDAFKNSKFCLNYRLGGSSNELDKIGGYVFDSLDDEDIASNGYSIDCLISVYEPATLGAALQITAEGSRFSPDYIGPTLVAMWEEYGIKATYETYFVDQEYRPNPKDFFPNEQLYQFSLSMIK